MALFGLLKDSKNPDGMSGNDKLALLFSGLSDFGSMRAGVPADAIDTLTKSFADRRAKAAKEAALNSLLEAATGKPLAAPAPIADPQSAGDYAPKFAPTSLTSIPQLPQARSAPMSYSDPRLPQMALKAKQLGVDPAVLMDWMKNTGEQRYEEGVQYRPYGGDNPAFIPKRQDGAMTTFGPDGQPTMMPIQGAADVAGTMAGAVSSAQEAAKARLDLIPVPQRDGSTRLMPRSVAAQMLGGGQGSGGYGAPDGLGVTQTPGDKIAQEGAARTSVERSAAEPQQWSGLQTQARTTDFVVDQIDKLLPKIGNMTAGFGSLLSKVPTTEAHDLATALDTIRGNVSFDKLQEMRQNSPTGGALGAVSDRENQLLASVLGSLDQAQSPGQLKENLTQLRKQLVATRDQRKGLYERTYGQNRSGGRQSAPQGAWTPAQARAELARRRAVAGGQ